MLNQRQEKLLIILENSSRWINASELSGVLGVSRRTIRSDVTTINKFYNEQVIESNQKLGYRHCIKNNITEIKVNNIKEQIPQTPQERCVYVIKELLMNGNGIELTELADIMFVSEYSIENDLKKIRKDLDKYGKLSIEKIKNTIRLEGDEESKRKLYKGLLAEETSGNFLNMNQLSSLFTKFDLLEVKNIFEDVLEMYNFHVREMVFPTLMIHIGVSIERMIQNYHITTERKSNEIFQSKEYTIAKAFYDKIQSIYNIDIVEDEVILLTLLIMGRKSTSYTEDLVYIASNEVHVEQLVDEILDVIKIEFSINFKEDNDLRMGLTMHLQSLLERHMNNVTITNVYLSEIKRKYPLIFEMAVRMVRFLHIRLNINIAEGEIGFLALHFGAAYERLCMQSKYRTIMIYPMDQAMSTLCVRKVENHFGERMDIVGCFGIFEEYKIKELNPNLILTTLPLTHSLNIPTVRISLFVNNTDESNIFQALNRLDKNKFKEEFHEQLLNLIKEDVFYYNLDLNNPEEIISYICDDLYKKKYVSKEFKQSVLQREAMSATSFVYSFSVPHALNMNALKSALAVALLKKPVVWGAYEVKMVLLIALTDEDYDIFKKFFEWLGEAINDVDSVSLLLQAQSYDDFINKLNKYMI